MKALLIYPEYPETFWNFKHALRFIGKKAAHPPMGLLTVAAMLPEEWELQLIDMNVAELREADLRWAEIVLISAMSIQERSAREVIAHCRTHGLRVVAGGPLFTSNPDAFDDVDFLVLNEAEVTLPQFLHDLAQGHPRHLNTSSELANLADTPIPRWELIDMRHYAAMTVQVSRGCPFDCEFCNITSLFGRAPRIKGTQQVISELERLYTLGWRGGVFFVDDNLIGNKAIVKREILPAIYAWIEQRKYPFSFNAQVSINLADDEELMALMVAANFTTVFVGIETPNDVALDECNKIPNKNRDLIDSVTILQRHGLQVQAGFIVGFDSDTPSIFDQLIRFIQESGIVTAMVGLLNAPYGTRLYQRLEDEGRLLKGMSGDNTDCSTNIVPALNLDVLLRGYQHIVQTIYTPNIYYQRLKCFLRVYHPGTQRVRKIKFGDLISGMKTAFVLGILEKERAYYWRLFFWSAFTRPRLLPLAMALAACGFHFRKCFEGHRTVSQ